MARSFPATRESTPPRSSAAAACSGRRIATRSRRRSSRCSRPERRRRFSRCTPSRRSGAASRVPGRSACCGSASHSTPIFQGRATPRLPQGLRQALARDGGLADAEIGDNAPYDGGLAGDTIDAIATSRGLSNALIEVRQDLIATLEDAEAWADRLAHLAWPLIVPIEAREPQNWGSRVVGGLRGPPPHTTPA